MSDGLTPAGRDLLRAIGDPAALPAIDEAVRARAEATAAALARDGVVTRVLRRGAGAYTVEVIGEGVLGRELGDHGRPAEPVVAAAIRNARRP